MLVILVRAFDNTMEVLIIVRQKRHFPSPTLDCCPVSDPNYTLTYDLVML